MAALNIGVSALFELVEPDDILPVGLPIDDIARRGVLRGAYEAPEAGGDEALEAFVRDQFGDYADDVLETMWGALCSFSGDTLIVTEDGLVPISEVDLWEKVLAYDEETGEIGYYPVIAVWEHLDPIIVTLMIDGEQIETTPEHPFYTADGDWLPAAHLQIGDEIRTADWKTGTVEAIRFTVAPQLMYNFTVATAHTYFVGDGQWLVHNICFSSKPVVENARLQTGLVDQLFRLGDTIPGGTAGAILAEGAGGVHWQKAYERLSQMQTILSSGKYRGATLNSSDLAIVQTLYDDLLYAIQTVSD